MKLIDLKEGQYLGDVLNKLPNGIIDKTYTANGGTTVEINAKRDSIIVAPLKSIANCKQKKFPKLIVVNGDVETERIRSKVLKLRKKKEFVKFITTPESIWKVKDALDTSQENIKGYFYLIDEIHMFQTESGYRNKMGRAVEEYFNHPRHNRAIMTASLYPFSDVRFKNEEQTKVIPNQQKKEINVYTCNNYSNAIKKIWNGEKFIFINSVIGAKKIETSLGFDCNIYCSNNRESMATADRSYRRFNESLSDVNIFTSAYFTGYDIEASGDIIIVVNAYANHTMLNLLTLYQITGRLRGTVGTIKLLVVFNRQNKTKMTKTELKENLLLEAGKQKAFWNNGLQSGMVNDGNKDNFKSVLESSNQNNGRLTRELNGSDKIEINYNAIDGEIIKWEASQLYSGIENLIDGINSTNQLNAKYCYFIDTPGLSQQDLRNISELRNLPRKRAFKKIVDLEENQRESILGKILVNYVIEDYEHSDYEYEVLMAQYIKLLGFDYFKATGGDKTKLKHGIHKANISKLAQDGVVIYKVKEVFDDKNWVSTADSKNILQTIFDDSNVNTTAKGSTIEWYYEVRESQRTINGKQVRGFEIISPRI